MAGRHLVSEYDNLLGRMSKRSAHKVPNHRSEYCFCSRRRTTCRNKRCSRTWRRAKKRSTVSGPECRGRQRLTRKRRAIPGIGAWKLSGAPTSLSLAQSGFSAAEYLITEKAICFLGDERG